MGKHVMSIDELREIGANKCHTNGSEHYINIRGNGGIDAIELAVKNGIFEDFAIVNIVKYALRFKHTRNVKDLAKVADYAHILSGLEIVKQKELNEARLEEEGEHHEKKICRTSKMPSTR